MIVLDTHVWVWWIHKAKQLSEKQFYTIMENEKRALGISAISCWEIAKLVTGKRLHFPMPLPEWFAVALSYPGIRLLPLTPEIAIESTQLPGKFHKDPADQIIVATARIHQCPLVTSDEKIISYRHAQIVY